MRSDCAGFSFFRRREGAKQIADGISGAEQTVNDEPVLKEAFARGVVAAGGNAVLAGVLPTPAVALLALAALILDHVTLQIHFREVHGWKEVSHAI